MTISFTCAKCGKYYPKVKSQLAGRKVRCHCGHEMRIHDVPENTSALDSKDLAESSTLQSKNVPRARGSGEPLVSTPTSAMELHYSDLDQILASSSAPDLPVRSATEHHFRSAAFSPPPVAAVHRSQINRPGSESKVIAKSSSTRLTISFLAVVASASMAFWFGSLVAFSRFAKFDHFLLCEFTETLTNINAGRFGLEELTPGLKIGFVITGWVIWSIAVVMVVLAVLQFGSALIQLFIQRQPLRWVDGLIGACGVALLFLFVATLFFHATHTANLKRPLRQFDSTETVLAGESELQNVRRIREQYDSESQRFMILMLVAGLAPLSVFGCSMVRLMTRTT